MKLINCITLILLVVTYTISQPTGKLDKFVDDVVDAIINKDKKEFRCSYGTCDTSSTIGVCGMLGARRAFKNICDLELFSCIIEEKIPLASCYGGEDLLKLD